ncbi:MAG: helix-turn-helix domain-containing protein [Ruminococcaceae bacterium]|nr:helix-turn-helix domain-containing protein [Oscillospiraceae bacterium]
MDGLHIYACKYEVIDGSRRSVVFKPPYHMLHFVVSGSGTFNDQRLTAGQAFLCRAGQWSSYMQNPDDPWSYYWINLSGAYADKLLDDCGFSGTDVIDYELTPEFSGVMKLASASRNPGFWEGMFIALAELLKNYRNAPFLSVPEQHIRDAEQIVAACGGCIKPSELAARLCLSRAYLRNIFMEHKGLSVQEYIIRARMKRAEDLLEQTDLPIAEIAAAVGYDDPFQMTKAFRKIHGRSPSAYRKWLKNSTEVINSVYYQ